MEQTVRDILASRTVRLNPISEEFQIYGFRCLGVAEKLLDFEDSDASPVYVWHIQDDILPLSKNEIERWSIDAPGKRHWILSEREFSESIFEDISDIFQINAWGPKKLSRWIGEAVLRGDLIVNADTHIIPEDVSDIIPEIDIPSSKNSFSLKPLIEINDWLDNESLNMVNTIPILINIKLWKISGTMIGPNSLTTSKNWSFIEDPWSGRIFQFNIEDVLKDCPNLRRINRSENHWKDIDGLKSSLKPLLDFRKKEKTIEGIDKVKSTMLEWWRVDVNSLKLESEYAYIPAWILNFEDGGKKILHSRNGKTYDYEI